MMGDKQVLAFTSQPGDEALLLTAVRTLTLLSRHPRTCEMLARGGLLGRLKDLIQTDDKEVGRQSGAPHDSLRCLVDQGSSAGACPVSDQILLHCATMLSFLARLEPIAASAPSSAPLPPPGSALGMLSSIASSLGGGGGAAKRTSVVASRAERLHEVVVLLSGVIEQPQAQPRTLVQCAEAVYGIAQARLPQR